MGKPQNRPRQGEVRIIAGSLRGSKLPVAEAGGLRPTSDRVRETLFNWLQHEIPGARVVDLFAGSGALGFEAASRGAAAVLLIERRRELAEQLRRNIERLKTAQVELRCDDALAIAAEFPASAFDIALIDPPFDADLWTPTLTAWLPKLAPRAFVYLESPREKTVPLPEDWALYREGKTREVRYALYRRGPA